MMCISDSIAEACCEQEDDFNPHAGSSRLGPVPREGAATLAGSLQAAEERVATAERMASSQQASTSHVGASPQEAACWQGLKSRLRFQRFFLQVCLCKSCQDCIRRHRNAQGLCLACVMRVATHMPGATQPGADAVAKTNPAVIQRCFAMHTAVGFCWHVSRIACHNVTVTCCLPVLAYSAWHFTSSGGCSV